MIKEKVMALYMANRTLNGTKFSINPLSKVSVDKMPDAVPAKRPPQIPNTIDNITSNGMVINAATTLGIIK